MSDKKSLCIISPVGTRSGYGQHSRLIIKSLLNNPKITERFDIKLVSLKWGSTPNTGLDPNNPEDKKLLELILPNNQLTFQPEVSIHITIPSEFQRIGKFSIGITAGTEVTVAPANFVQGCNQVDLVITPSEFTKAVLLATKVDKKEGDQIVETWEVKKPIEVLFEGLDLEVFDKNKPIEPDIQKYLDALPDKFLYLMTGMWVQGHIGQDRKDVGMVIKTFIDTFKRKKNRPGLVLKTSGAGFSITERDQILDKINQVRDLVKSEGFNGTFPNVYLLHGDLTDNEMNSLYNHPKIKAMVSFTKGEGFCIVPGTKVITSLGLKNIEEISIGDHVLSHTGHFRLVSQVMNRTINEPIQVIKTYGSNVPIQMTNNHEVFVFNEKSNEYFWKSAQNLTIGDCVCLPKNRNSNKINKINILDFINNNIREIEGKLKFIHSNKISDKNVNNEINLNANFGKIIGYYLSEGTCSSGGIIFSIHKNELETIGNELRIAFKEVFDVDKYKIRIREGSNSAQIIFYSKIAHDLLLKICGHLAKKKRMPAFIFNSCEDFQRNVLSSIIVGDGHINSKSVGIQLVNENLISDVRILSYLIGIPSTGYAHKIIKQSGHIAPSIGWGEIESYNKLITMIKLNHKFISTDIRSIKRHYSKRAFLKDDFSIFKIKEIYQIHYSGIVYNLSVDIDETYCLENFTVHNCLPLLEFCTTGKPVICSAHSGPMDFLDPEYSVLLPGKLTKIDGSAANEWLPKEGEWFTVNYTYAGQVLNDMFENYNKYWEKSRKYTKIAKEKFSIQKMSDKFLEIFEKYYNLVEEPKRLSINLPKLKKI